MTRKYNVPYGEWENPSPLGEDFSMLAYRPPCPLAVLELCTASRTSPLLGGTSLRDGTGAAGFPPKRGDTAQPRGVNLQSACSRYPSYRL